MNDRELIRAAKGAYRHAYAPYSKFRVGAAVLCHSGGIFAGSNVENASLGLTVCAERVATFAAVSAGERVLTKITIVSDAPGWCYPCGACRQVLAEFGPGLKVILVNGKGRVKKLDLKELLPHSFSLSAGL